MLIKCYRKAFFLQIDKVKIKYAKTKNIRANFFKFLTGFRALIILILTL